MILECRLARGDLVEATAAGDDLVELLGTPGWPAAFALYGRAALAAALGDPHEAADLFTAVGDHTGSSPRSAALLPWRVGASLALLHTRSRGAGDLAGQHLELAGASGSAPAVALALRTTAACARGGQTVALLREALALLTGVQAERLTAQIATDLAEMLMLTNDPATRNETISLLRQAEGYAGREQLRPLRGRVRRALDRLGEQEKLLESERLASLTPAERLVCALAASGRSNREIAEALGVSVKSVEWHLSRVYR